ncbi:DsbA family protein [Mycetocola saprophilus]|uniref:DsbA family protein n=1 Tax=Mycetocola saprophilus TaxID=76636 RepID=UPI0004BF5C92|nr:thioredoxin domain-containing protein [Mycetocola saprophilus]
MTNDADPKSPRNRSVRQAARERATELRSAQRRKDILGRVLLIGAGVIVVGAIVVGVVMSLRTTEPSATTTPANMISGGIVVGAGLKAVRTDSQPIADPAKPTEINPAVPNIRIYADYIASDMGEFQKANAEMLETLVKDGAITVEYHPIAPLASKSAGSQYSVRAANAAACVANFAPDQFFAFNAAMYKDQPTEGTTGRSDDDLVKLAKDAKVSDASSIEECITKQTYKGWVSSVTDTAMNQPVPNSKLDKVVTMPTILVNEKLYTGELTSSKEFRAFVLSIASETQNKASVSPTPSTDPTDGATPAG